jgi:hypothetical protein
VRQAIATRTTWLFTRGDDSVLLEIQLLSDGARLLVSGPGDKREFHDFADIPELLAYQRIYQQRRCDEGYTVEQFLAERRRTPR